MKEVSIVDGSGYVFRAYYGMPMLTNAQGQPVQAIVGFFKMILSLWKISPEYFCIAWDSPGPTLRKQQVDSYKANRVKQPNEFVWQMRAIKEIVPDIGIPFIEQPGYEADDIIASLVRQKAHDDIYTIVSSDKDLKQLVSPTVIHYDAMKEKRTGPQEFVEEYGFEATLMGDYLALVGDASDNIPGVPGIGPKAARTLIQKFKTVTAIYENIDKLEGSMKEKLIAGKESALQSYDLVKLYGLPNGVPSINTLQRKPDCAMLKKILIEGRSCHSLGGIINEIDQQERLGTQGSLF